MVSVEEFKKDLDCPLEVILTIIKQGYVYVDALCCGPFGEEIDGKVKKVDASISKGDTTILLLNDEDRVFYCLLPCTYGELFWTSLEEIDPNHKFGLSE